MSEKSGCFCFLRVKVSSDQKRPKEGCRKWTKDPGGVKGAPQTHWQANYLEVFLKWGGSSSESLGESLTFYISIQPKEMQMLWSVGHTLSDKVLNRDSAIIVVAKGRGRNTMDWGSRGGINGKNRSQVILRNKLQRPCQNGNSFGHLVGRWAEMRWG